jgi:uncharacterized protein (DUF608 family)
LDVVLVAYSPFIPLDQDNSSLPLTTIHIELQNKGGAPVDVTVTGWMENGVHKGRKDFDTVHKRSSSRNMPILKCCFLVAIRFLLKPWKLATMDQWLLPVLI